jgi:hypothetical protein
VRAWSSLDLDLNARNAKDFATAEQGVSYVFPEGPKGSCLNQNLSFPRAGHTAFGNSHHLLHKTSSTVGLSTSRSRFSRASWVLWSTNRRRCLAWTTLIRGSASQLRCRPKVVIAFSIISVVKRVRHDVIVRGGDGELYTRFGGASTTSTGNIWTSYLGQRRHFNRCTACFRTVRTRRVWRKRKPADIQISCINIILCLSRTTLLAVISTIPLVVGTTLTSVNCKQDDKNHQTTNNRDGNYSRIADRGAISLCAWIPRRNT